jgi:hypothetical protein
MNYKGRREDQFALPQSGCFCLQQVPTDRNPQCAAARIAATNLSLIALAGRPNGSIIPQPVRLIRSAGAPMSNAAVCNPARHRSPRPRHHVSGHTDGTKPNPARWAAMSPTASPGSNCPVTNTRPVRITRSSSIVWPTTTNSRSRSRRSASRAQASRTS